MSEFVTPPAVSRGGNVLVIAPSSGGAANARHVLELGLERLEDVFGLTVTVHPSARQSDEYLLDHPEVRAAAIHQGFRDPDIEAVIATIGGDDQLRVLKFLDPELLRKNPTRFFGMSDNTNLGLYLWTLGIVSYYGGQLLNQVATPGEIHPHSVEYLERALFQETIGELDAADEWADLTLGWEREDYASAALEYEPAPGWTWAGGTDSVSGRLWGGCAGIIEWQLMADRHLPLPNRLDGAILALETSEVLPSADQVKWLLMSMGERGLLQRFDGVLVGRPATQNWQELKDDDERQQFRADQQEVIRSQMERYNPEAPIVFDLDFGHTDPTTPIPIGGQVRIEPEERIVFE